MNDQNRANALRSLGYRWLLASGFLLTLAGNLMSTMAIISMSQLTGESAWWVAVMGAVDLFTFAGSSPIGMWLVRRWDARLVLRLSLGLLTLVATTIGAGIVFGFLTPLLLVLAQVPRGVADAGVSIADWALQVELVDRKAIPSAVGFSGSVTWLARLLGPLAAAVFVTWLNSALAFATVAACFAGAVALLSGVGSSHEDQASRRKRVGHLNMRDSWREVRRLPPFLIGLLTVVMLSLIGTSSLVPYLAHLATGGPTSDVAWYTGAITAGVLVSQLAWGVLSSRTRIRQDGWPQRWVTGGAALAASGTLVGLAGWPGLASSGPGWASYGAVALIGVGHGFAYAGATTSIQVAATTNASTGVRSIQSVTFAVSNALGRLLAGGFGDRGGARSGLLYSAAVAAAAGLVHLGLHAVMDGLRRRRAARG